jgi:methyltransferase-like protein/2-polyprenyl-3-methyl-5-hydroxy-6-metoxy-1,4-benzoquinol methylase
MNEIVEKLKADYDAVAYESWEHYHAHPDRIAVTATLRGLVPPPVNNCRVLEIACARGGNLLPMAEQMPASRFVGIDLSPRQIESGSALVRELGLTNIELRCQDLMDFPENAGTFDYIIAHGFYSWVPELVRKQLMTVCRRHLADNGLAFISYNTFPGWRGKGAIRDMMLYHARNATDPAERVKRGREIVQLVAEHTLQKASYKSMVSEYSQSISNDIDSHLLHDYMEVINEAVYFRDFVSEAQAHGLAHVGDANPEDDYWDRIPAPLRDSLSKMSADIVERDQYMDFLTNRMFRRSILCRAEAALGTPQAAANQIRKLYIASCPTEKPAGANAAGKPLTQFGTEHNRVQLSDPRPIAAMRHLRGAWPSAVPFSDLAAVVFAHAAANQKDPEGNAEALAHVIETCFSLGIVELWSRPTDHISPTAGQYPRATRWARWQAAHLPMVTSLRHSQVKTDDLLRLILPLVDGTRDRKALVAEWVKQDKAARPAKGEALWANRDPQSLEQLIDVILQRMASLSLLVTN